MSREHESIASSLRNVYIVVGSVVVMIVVCLVAAHLLLRSYARKRPMQSMQTLGILTAPDNRPLTRLPKPALELDDGHADFMALDKRQNVLLNSYGWIDRSNGLAQIPVERAMALMIARGFAVNTNLTALGTSSKLNLGKTHD